MPKRRPRPKSRQEPSAPSAVPQPAAPVPDPETWPNPDDCQLAVIADLEAAMWAAAEAAAAEGAGGWECEEEDSWSDAAFYSQVAVEMEMELDRDDRPIRRRLSRKGPAPPAP